MSVLKLYYRILSLVVSVSFLLLPTTALSGQILSLSIKNIQLDANERIVGFELKVISGGIRSIGHTPMGWSIQIDNDASWNTVMKGNVEVGSAALDAAFFKDFVMIEKAPQTEPPFNIEMILITTTDFKKEKRYSLKENDLLLRYRPK
jgi:hypothetical protein